MVKLDSLFVIIMSLAFEVHCGSNTALLASVMTDEGARDKIPFEGRVNGVQWACKLDDEDVEVGFA